MAVIIQAFMRTARHADGKSFCDLKSEPRTPMRFWGGHCCRTRRPAGNRGV